MNLMLKLSRAKGICLSSHTTQTPAADFNAHEQKVKDQPCR
jgi:hypothetical protein